jgi:hypothetical protein
VHVPRKYGPKESNEVNEMTTHISLLNVKPFCVSKENLIRDKKKC